MNQTESDLDCRFSTIVMFACSVPYCIVSVLLVLVSLCDQLPEADVMKDDELGIWHLPYSFRDVHGLLLASAWNAECKTPSSFIYMSFDQQ